MDTDYYAGGSGAFDTALALVLRDEGGFTNDPNDNGNWTGGRVGAGGCTGTNFGISAASYPTLDIANLTIADATQIYWRDWWAKYHLDRLPDPFGAKCFDIGVNMGAAEAIRLLQLAAVGLGATIHVDGMIGPDTVGIVQRLNPATLWAAFVGRIEDHYRSIVRANPRDQNYLAGWLRRADETIGS